MTSSLTDLSDSLLHLERSYLATVAIDFGTTYSGFAFSFNKEEGEDAIFMNRDWKNELGHRTSKTPTCLLLKPDQSFDSFGYKAIEKYANLSSMFEEKEYLFFQHFKMCLHSSENLNLDTKIKAANGQSLPAKKVFAHSIKFLKEEAVNIIRQETGDDSFKDDDIQWVLTVPAIWSPRAKQFMREAAYEAGIGSRDNPEQLLIALEPEAAAIFCTDRKLDDPTSEKNSVSVEGQLSAPNSQYMVVDIGGGTLDVTVHEKEDNGAIKEVYKVTGGPYGGMKVNIQFQSLLDKVFGAQKLCDYRTQFPSDWLKLINDFEAKKRGARALDRKETRIRLPLSFISSINDFLSSSMKRYKSGDVKILNDEYLCLSSKVMVKLFEPVLEAMKDHLNGLLSRPELCNVKVMLLVGGFAESFILQEEIKKQFSRRCRVIVPRDASIAVVQGAVIFGKKPAKITQRVVSKTYGADCCRDFVKGVHPEANKFVVNGKDLCSDVFNCFVKENEVVKLGERIKSMYRPLYPDEKQIKYSFYASNNPNPLLITDNGVTRIGSVVVQSPDTWRGMDRQLEVSMYFGGTEITATARDISSGNTAQTTLNFLSDDLPSNFKDNSPWKNTSILSNVITSEGGVVVKDSVKLVFPPGAVENPVSVNITLEDPCNYYGLIVQKDLENDVMFVAPIINLEPSGHFFKKPLTLVTKFKINDFKWDDVLILHGSKARDGKITWQDITKMSKIDEANAEVIIEIEHFSLIASLGKFCRSTLIRTKEIASRLNLLSFNYTLSVLLNKSSPSSVHDELALLFVSQDVYHEQFYREDETSSALMQLKKDGFLELRVCSITRQEEKSIYNNENLQINVHLGEDYNLAERQQEKTSFTVHSYVWWNTGMVIRLPLEWKKDVRRLCGKISVQGEYGHTSERHFSEHDLCGYVRSLLGVEGSIFNLIPIAQLLEMPEESINQVAKCWKDEEEQLEIIIQHWSRKNDVVEDLAALRKDLESLQQKDYMVTKRGQMHIRHLRKLATKISSLQCVNADLVNYFVRKIQTLCKSVLRDCCIELEGYIEAASCESYAEYLIQSIESHGPPPEDISRKYQQVCSSSEKATTKTFLIIVPYLIQNIKDIFVDERISEGPQNGLRGLPKEKLDHFVSSVRNAEGNNRFHELVCESCNILEQLCLKNHDKQPTAEIEKWGKSLTILSMLNFLKPFFQHCRQDVRLHQRLDLFSCRLRDIMANREDIDEVVVYDLSNLLLSLIHFAKFDPSKLVRFELIDSTNFPLICPRENVRYDKHEHTYSQVFRIKKESKGQLQLHATARVYINGKICKRGTFQSEIMLKASSEEAFDECSIHFEDVTVVKLEDNADTENRQVVLCSTQREKLLELLDVLKQELRMNVADVNQSKVKQCDLTMRTVTTKAGVVVSLCLVYKWGSEAVFLNSDDFVTFADLSTGCLCTPGEQVVDLSKDGQATDKQPEEGSTIRDNANDCQILIKMMNGRKIPLAVDPNDFIKNVKKKIQQLNECPPDRQRLVFVGRKLKDHRTLSDYNVRNGSTLILVQRLRDAPMDDTV